MSNAALTTKKAEAGRYYVETEHGTAWIENRTYGDEWVLHYPPVGRFADEVAVLPRKKDCVETLEDWLANARTTDPGQEDPLYRAGYEDGTREGKHDRVCGDPEQTPDLSAVGGSPSYRAGYRDGYMAKWRGVQ